MGPKKKTNGCPALKKDKPGKNGVYRCPERNCEFFRFTKDKVEEHWENVHRNRPAVSRPVVTITSPPVISQRNVSAAAGSSSTLNAASSSNTNSSDAAILTAAQSCAIQGTSRVQSQNRIVPATAAFSRSSTANVASSSSYTNPSDAAILTAAPSCAIGSPSLVPFQNRNDSIAVSTTVSSGSSSSLKGNTASSSSYTSPTDVVISTSAQFCGSLSLTTVPSKDELESTSGETDSHSHNADRKRKVEDTHSPNKKLKVEIVLPDFTSDESGRYTCPKDGCPKIKLCETYIQEHWLRCHGPKNFACSVCQKAFGLKRDCNGHKKIHDKSIKTKIPCNLCQTNLSTKQNLKKHLRRKHRLTEAELVAYFVIKSEPKAPVGIITLQLPESDATVTEPTVYPDFECVDGYYPCPVSECTTVKHLLGFIKVHWKFCHGPKLHKCRLCSKNFSSPARLKRHEKTHTTEKPYQCPLCDTLMRLKANIKRHLKNVHSWTTEKFNKFYDDPKKRKCDLPAEENGLGRKMTSREARKLTIQQKSARYKILVKRKALRQKNVLEELSVHQNEALQLIKEYNASSEKDRFLWARSEKMLKGERSNLPPAQLLARYILQSRKRGQRYMSSIKASNRVVIKRPSGFQHKNRFVVNLRTNINRHNKSLVTAAASELLRVLKEDPFLKFKMNGVNFRAHLKSLPVSRLLRNPETTSDSYLRKKGFWVYVIVMLNWLEIEDLPMDQVEQVIRAENEKAAMDPSLSLVQCKRIVIYVGLNTKGKKTNSYHFNSDYSQINKYLNRGYRAFEAAFVDCNIGDFRSESGAKLHNIIQKSEDLLRRTEAFIIKFGKAGNSVPAIGLQQKVCNKRDEKLSKEDGYWASRLAKEGQVKMFSFSPIPDRPSFSGECLFEGNRPFRLIKELRLPVA